MPVEVIVTRAGPYDPISMAAIHRACFAKAWDEAAMAQFLASQGGSYVVAPQPAAAGRGAAPVGGRGGAQPAGGAAETPGGRGDRP